jgi:peptidoglycan-associated lipoprotein
VLKPVQQKAKHNKKRNTEAYEKADDMRTPGKLLMAAILLLLGACTNLTGYDDTNAVNLGGAGSASDPTSTAYFQQAVGDRVLFVVNSSSLSPEGEATLAAQATWLTTNSDYVAIIEGHADEQGTREYNLALGARRANTVREYLMSRGVAGARLKVVSYGKERPIELCSNESCYSKNRRAVTVLSGGLTG